MPKLTLNLLHHLLNVLIIFVLFTCQRPLFASSVKNIALPFITNYPKSTYNAGTQNWAITQNTKGFIYFGNNDGLLEFDGKQWHRYKIPNNSIIRSVFAVGDTIYIGAFEECGFFAPDKTGVLTYHSLVQLIPYMNCSFDEIWKIYQIDNALIFQSFRFLFILKDNQIKVLPPLSSFSLSFQIGKQIYVVDRTAGLMIFENEALRPTKADPILGANEIRCILRFDSQRLLIGTNNSGLFLLDNDKLIQWNSAINSILKNDILFSAIRLQNGYFAFGSVQNGLYITDETGRVIQHLDRFRGLQNNTVLSLFEDKQHDLWLGLDNGIDFIEISSPISIFNYKFNLESTYTSLIYKDYWYVGTNQGLYVADKNELTQTNEHSFFKIIPGTEGQVWFLKVLDNQVFCGHNFGCFLINNDKATKLSDERGFWTIIPDNVKPGTYIAGLYDGLGLITKRNDTWSFVRMIEGFNVSSKSVLQDHDGFCWISHGYRGLYRVKLDSALTRATEIHYYNGNNGLPTQLPYAIHKLDDEIVFSTVQGFYSFDKESKLFKKATQYERLFPEKAVYESIETDVRGNIWYFTTDFMGVNQLQENGSYVNITAPFVKINPMLIPAFKNIFVYGEHNVFIGSQNGLIHYDPFINKDYQHIETVFLREIRCSSEDSTMRLSPMPDKLMQSEANPTKIPYRFNSISFLYASPSFETNEANKYAYRLKGFDQSWSSWESISFKEYTNLPFGSYVFEVKSLNVNMKESYIATFSFVIEPPMSRSNMAYFVYIVLFVLFVIVNFMFLKRRFRKAQEKEALRHEKQLNEQKAAFREKSLMAERAIINLRNETLQGQVVHKNKELANTTQHLIHKNKILNIIKHQLVDVNKQVAEESKKDEINQVIKRINKDLKNEKLQEVFDAYFDDVHQDFITRLKINHKNLTPNDLRLCAYLKMNLSSKQIAPLMNISVRGVEIGRYRLRKKLKIDRESNLVEYLLGL